MKKTTKKVNKKTVTKDTTTFRDRKLVFKTILVSTLRFNPLNPVIRTDETSHTFKALMHNIRINGLLSPIIIASNNMVIDGNRRLRALQLLKVKKVAVVQHNSTTHKTFDDLFVACNENTMSINACQELERYLNGAKIKRSTYVAIKRIQDIGGKATLRRIVNVNKSPVTFAIGIGQLSSYTGYSDKKFLKLALKWMLNVGSAYRLKASINELIPVTRLVNAIETQTPLIAKWHQSFKPLTEGENLTTIPVQSVQVNGDNEVVGYTTA